MKKAIFFLICIMLVGCSNDREFKELQRKQQLALKELERKEAEFWALKRSDRNAFAEAMTRSSIDERHDALNQFILAYPSSPLVDRAIQEVQKLEIEIEKRRQRDNDLDRRMSDQKKTLRHAAELREAQKEAIRQQFIAEKNRCINLVKNRVANLYELNIALKNMTENEVINLIGKPTRVEMRRHWIYEFGIGIEQATGRKRGIIIRWGKGSDFIYRVSDVIWRI